jgi:hypothetical protein
LQFEGRRNLIQIIFHLFGDYILQSDWMAQNKTKANLPAFCHALTYSAAFLLLTIKAHHPWVCWLVIFGTHFLIDRFRLARYVVWAKNFMAPKGSVPDRWNGQEQKSYPRRNWDWNSCKDTGGYAPNTPAFMWIWLMIIADNTLHLAINYFALTYL